MLVLKRHVGESLSIGDGIKITVVRIGENMVRLGIDAPKGVQIVREELHVLVPKNVKFDDLDADAQRQLARLAEDLK